MRLAIFLFALVALAPAAGAQEQTGDAAVDEWSRARCVAETRRRLLSSDPKDRAWAAYLIGYHRLAENAGFVLDALRREEDNPLDRSGIAVRALALDALLLTDFRAKAADLLPHARGVLLPAVVILMARRSGGCLPGLTRLFDDHEDGNWYAWVAAGNLLAAGKAPGFAARLLARLDIEVELRVWDHRGSYRGPSGSVVGCSRTEVPDGFPPLVLYKLGDPPPEDRPADLPPLLPHFPVADGPRPIYGCRVERESRIWNCSPSDPAERDVCRSEWLDELMQSTDARQPEDGIRGRCWWRMNPYRCPTGLGPPARPAVDLRWAGTPPLLRQTRWEHEALVTTYWDSVRHLLAAELLTEDEARTLDPKVVVRFRDFRRDRRIPLPEVPRLPVHPWKTMRRTATPRQLR